MSDVVYGPTRLPTQFDVGYEAGRKAALVAQVDRQRLERIATAVLATIVPDSGSSHESDAKFAISAARALIAELDKEPK